MRTAVFIASLTLLGGCSTKPVLNPDNLADQWGARLRAYQIYPVFPPREDIQVGDLYGICAKKTNQRVLANEDQVALGRTQATGPSPISVWLSRIDEFRSSIGQFYSTAVTLPPASAPSGVSSPGATSDYWPMPTSQNFVSGNSSAARLRNASLPEFFTASVSQAQVGALVPAGVVLAGLGFSSEDVGSVSVSVPAAGSYGLPEWDSLKIAKSSQLWKTAEFWKWSNDYLSKYSRFCQTDEKPVFLLVTEVIAAYALDINFAFTKATASKLQVAMAEPTGSTKQATLDSLLKYFSTTPPTTAKTADAPGAVNKGAKGLVGSQPEAASDAKGQVNPAQDLAAELKSLLASATGSEQQQFPGLSAQVVTGSSSGVKIQRTFANPVVIGYRAMAFDLKKNGTAPTDAFPPNVERPLNLDDGE
ncbi:hypothetical protein EN871_18100 [bacterium M00.F.Ca.ET.228.01.1.1]|nr:hypothetical protein EN871_18100 [bacterium M00.F.Ca.ET.228.01.1.1]TGR99028.1 hypothetical protein EN834_20740 [bacterium M00.F.Ca.ET.191.01.1.1]TGU03340.1 hypothetical protein EN798_21560 [bacterium M00.F.Ca.ET.155.01.1.1]